MVTEIKPVALCFVCQEEKNTNTPPTDPETPPRIPKPCFCSSCCQDKDIEWTYNRYTLEIGNEYNYDWYCSDCLQEQIWDT